MPSLKTKKQVQSLNGKLAALTRFLSKAAERSFPFFHTLKDCTKKSDFKWIDEAEKRFQEMKTLLKDLPTLTAPVTGQALILYLAVSKEAVSSILVAEQGDAQMPIYLVSKALSGSELNYLPIEKLLYAFIITSRRLRRYFQAHPITVLTDQPIRQLLYNPKISGRLTKWAIELGEHEIAYCARNAIKDSSTVFHVHSISSTLGQESIKCINEWHPPIADFNPTLPKANERAHKPHPNMIAVYDQTLEVGNVRIPPTTFFMRVYLPTT
ncbi:uncharacterized protein [Rutidosis leptorrhynchoides]|uniref:uncharacterized protein n=1 Tax=Rutidosis leptorrhynchoides TaxID=125765 RepID=UPI003A9A3290